MTVDLITVMIFDLLMVFREFSILISVCVCAFWIAACFIAVFPELLCVGVLAYHIGLFTNMKKEFPKYFTPFRVPTYHTLKLVRLSLALLASCFLGALPLARYSWTSLDRRLY